MFSDKLVSEVYIIVVDKTLHTEGLLGSKILVLTYLSMILSTFSNWLPLPIKG